MSIDGSEACGIRPGILGTEALGKIERILFLDRDGVINVNLGYVHSVAETQWVPGVFEFSKRARNAGYSLVIVTNQAGIARGYYSEEEFINYTHWMHQQFEQRGVDILATFYCPHHPTEGLRQYRKDCCCRKPMPGMLQAARNEFSFGTHDEIMVGDSITDMIAAERAGIRRRLLFNPERDKMACHALDGVVLCETFEQMESYL